MIVGIAFLVVSIFSFIVVIRTDYEDVVVEEEDSLEEKQNRVLLFLGFLILFVIGVFLIIKNI
jgi:hypothetical protein